MPTACPHSGSNTEAQTARVAAADPLRGNSAAAEPNQSFPILGARQLHRGDRRILVFPIRTRLAPSRQNTSAQSLTSAPSLVAPVRPQRQIAHPLEEPGTGSPCQARLPGSGGRGRQQKAAGVARNTACQALQMGKYHCLRLAERALLIKAYQLKK
ncbi:hypothetical protein SKAU_G00340880 [Synaphobranchus kaupii]|uniref:Uncharacterized protein n=1 Tax=Synaphobranchus kaupii TaxID=118154 RepID=A0A9Q1EN54_SYNKA|nr:hypothetical protein SKAU_G00340880 [Synaphobranchus kaupii]